MSQAKCDVMHMAAAPGGSSGTGMMVAGVRSGRFKRRGDLRAFRGRLGERGGPLEEDINNSHACLILSPIIQPPTICREQCRYTPTDGWNSLREPIGDLATEGGVNKDIFIFSGCLTNHLLSHMHTTNACCKGSTGVATCYNVVGLDWAVTPIESNPQSIFLILCTRETSCENVKA